MRWRKKSLIKKQYRRRKHSLIKPNTLIDIREGKRFLMHNQNPLKCDKEKFFVERAQLSPFPNIDKFHQLPVHIFFSLNILKLIFKSLFCSVSGTKCFRASKVRLMYSPIQSLIKFCFSKKVFGWSLKGFANRSHYWNEIWSRLLLKLDFCRRLWQISFDGRWDLFLVIDVYILRRRVMGFQPACMLRDVRGCEIDDDALCEIREEAT